MACDFSGYATKNNLRCSDGRIIRQDAFVDNDQTRVPLVWAHIHTDPNNVLGHADLENRSDGVYAYCTFNDTQAGQNAKKLVQHGDITAMSIYANKLVQRGSDVVHGIIREVSLVMAGANPGALINPLSIAHGDVESGEVYYTPVDGEAIIYTDEEFIVHSDDDDEEDDMAANNESEETIQDIIDTMDEKQRKVLEYLVGQALSQGSAKHSADDDEDDYYLEDEDDYLEHEDGDETIQDVLDSMDAKQRKVLEFLVGHALANGGDISHGDMEEDMKFNAFDSEYDGANRVTDDDIRGVFEYARGNGDGSLKHAFEDAGITIDDIRGGTLSHGVENLDILFPEARMVGEFPEIISREMTWVDKVWGAFHKTPFARIRSVAANITEYEARARGYVKGTQKIEEVINLLGRSTTPQTVYKLQKIDRDDVIDITDLDIVAFMKREMRIMLNEEIVKAALVGDDRPNNDPSRIKPEHIRPIYQDDDVYTIHENVTIGSSATFNDIADRIIETAVLSRKNYMGSGTPTMYASTDIITRMLLAKDQLGHRLYRNEGELAAALRVKEIVEVPIFDGVTRTASITTESEGQTTTVQETRKLLALIVNLADYSIGADKKGAVDMFDDFDLNFNRYEYLIETRCSGALTKPYSAIAIETTGDLPFTFGTVTGMYKGSKTQRDRIAAGTETPGD